MNRMVFALLALVALCRVVPAQCGIPPQPPAPPDMSGICGATLSVPPIDLGPCAPNSVEIPGCFDDIESDYYAAAQMVVAHANGQLVDICDYYDEDWYDQQIQDLGWALFACANGNPPPACEARQACYDQALANTEAKLTRPQAEADVVIGDAQAQLGLLVLIAQGQAAACCVTEWEWAPKVPVETEGTKMVRKQCSKCPWKVSTNPHDIPNGYSEEAHRRLGSTIARSPEESIGSTLRMMACHETAMAMRDEDHPLPCVGWLVQQLGPGNNIGLRMAVARGQVDADVEPDGLQHMTLEDTFPS